MNWEKGPVCGIDNCPSDLWRSAAGRTFCRYGHQRQDEYEYDNQDEGDLGGGRKVTIGSVSAMKDGEKEEQRWFGSRVYALRAQIFQEVLRFYTHWAMQKFDLDTDFEEVVKELWSVLIKYTDFGRSSYDLEGGVHSEPCDTGTSTPLLLSQKMAIEIMYLALVQVGYPISFIKILGWIMSGNCHMMMWVQGSLQKKHVCICRARVPGVPGRNHHPAKVSGAEFLHVLRHWQGKAS